MSNQQNNRTDSHSENTTSCRRMLALGVMIALGAVGSAAADVVDGELDGFYVPQYGWAVTQEVSRPDQGEPPTQIGSYSIVLSREDWDELPAGERKRVRKILGLKGSLHGVMEMQSFTVSHTLGVEARNGVLYTAGDYLLTESGDMTCSEGVPLAGVEVMNFSMGSGLFEDLAEGSLQVRGVVNNCPGRPEYLQNDFSVIPGVGGILFDPVSGPSSQP